MRDRNLIRGLFVIAFALVFGLGALRYPVGELTRLGPGMFPRIMSSLLLLIGIALLVQSRYAEHAPLEFHAKSIALVMASILGLALISAYVNMTAGIVFLVFCASLAGTSFSVMRNLKVATGLVAVALVFQKLLGVNLPLY